MRFQDQALQRRSKFLAGAAGVAVFGLMSQLPARASGWTAQSTPTGAQLLYDGQVVVQATITPTTLTAQSAGGTFSLPAAPVVNKIYEPAPGFQVQYQGSGYAVYTGGSALATQPQTTGTLPGLPGQTILLTPTYQYQQKNCNKPPCPQDLAECVDDLLEQVVMMIAIVFAALAALTAPPPLDAAAAAAFFALVAEYIQLELKTEYDCGFAF